MAEVYRFAQISIGGHVVDVDGGFAEISLDRARESDEASYVRGTTAITVSSVGPVPGFDAERLYELLRGPTRGVRTEDLVRRASYGGRKGRRALRRLVEQHGFRPDDALVAAMVSRLMRRDREADVMWRQEYLGEFVTDDPRRT